MSDERDIDEILASLDALLREGGSHNDDHVDDASEVMPEPQEFQVKDVGLAFASPAMGASDVSDTGQAFAPVGLAAGGAEEVAMDERTGSDSPENTVVTEAAESTASMGDELPRVLLTEDMMLDNPQSHLPFDAGMRADEASPQAVKFEDAFDEEVEAHSDALTEACDIAVEEAVVLDAAVLNRLAHTVAEDVQLQLRGLLPGMIHETLLRHMHASGLITPNTKIEE